MPDGPDRPETVTLDGRPTAQDLESAPGTGAPPQTSERYRVIGRLGKGGMGEVMLVRDQHIGREVALKRIRRTSPSERLVQRFLREASVQGRLEHPAIVPLYDLSTDASGQPFFTMKRLTGTTLRKLLAEPGDTSRQRLLRAFAEVCLAVELAHTRGVIHRDLKPDNIVLGDFGEVYVLDWGVAKIVGETDGEFSDVGTDGSGDDEQATVPGTALGTPGYMAPEQARGEIDIDARADVYALGCILFEILARSPRSRGQQLGEPRDERPSERAPERSIPPELDALCVEATAIDPARRLATARELGERVQQYLDGDRDLASRKKLAVLQLAAAQAAFASGDDEERRRVAMRDAASALALDPTLAGAAELVARLMLEPPRMTPREVTEEIREEDVQSMRSRARVGVWLYLGFLAFTPLLWWIAPSKSPYVIALTVMVTCNLALCWWGWRSRPLGREGLLAVSNTILLAIVAHMFTPFLAAPGMAAMSVLVIVLTPTISRLTTAFTMAWLGCLAVLGPWVLERIGVLGVTTRVGAGGVMLQAPGIAGDETSTLVVGVLYVVGLIAGAAVLASAMRARETTARRHLHLQAWQLRQLVAH
jgi:serine/threonine-protein kinase